MQRRISRAGIAGLIVAAVVIAGLARGASADAAATAPAAGPTVEQRLANLEAYVTNSAPDAGGGALAATPGPGHNGWMMMSTALVLFMTLPGLALFYGGLVRRKNVLSVLAQCFGCAGMVTVLWWMFGYSMVFSSQAADSAQRGSTFLGSFKTF